MINIDQTFDILGARDVDILEAQRDTVTLENWHTAQVIADDMQFVLKTLAAAYDAGGYSVRRKSGGLGDDLPVGAAIGVPDGRGGLFFQGMAQDHELSDRDAHAEVNAMRHWEYMLKETNVGQKSGSLILAVTAEPCPACLDAIDTTDLDITRVVYGASRESLEGLGLLRPHGRKAPEIVAAARSEKSSHEYEIFQIPSAQIQAACLELLLPYARDLASGEVAFKPDDVRTTRLATYLRNLYGDERTFMTRRVDEVNEISGEFADVLAHFGR